MNRRQFIRNSAYLAGLGSFARLSLGSTGAAPARRTIVMDTYEPLEMPIEAWRKAGVNVVVRDVMNWKDSPPLELVVGPRPQPASAMPQPGLNIFDQARDDDGMMKLAEQGIREELKFLAEHRDQVALASTIEEAEQIAADGRIALFMMLKAAWINRDLSVLRSFQQMGVRLTALSHAAALDWADSAYERNAKPGLSGFGREFVQECDRLGIVVDLSHASDETAWDVLAASRRPLIASHSGCRAVTNVPRAMPDNLLRALAGNGGMIGIFAVNFETREYELAQIEHAVKTVGIDHVGLCSHSMHLDKWEGFEAELRKQGYGDEDIRKLTGGNFFRIFSRTLGLSRLS